MNRTGYILITVLGVLALGGGIYLFLKNRKRVISPLPSANIPMGNNLDTDNTTKTKVDKSKYIIPPHNSPYSEDVFPLKRGSGGKKVKVVQDFLNKLGANLNVDGKFGPKTEEAWIEWQLSTNIKLGIEGTGIQGKVTESVYKRNVLGVSQNTNYSYNQVMTDTL
mgnify:CR=1 FL=1|tara:strand:- start:230 stop:724 length:495 start_codon:yes stop_codon:yes gene_type:complete